MEPIQNVHGSYLTARRHSVPVELGCGKGRAIANFEATAGTWEGITISGGMSSSTTGGPSLDTNFHTFEIRNDGVNDITFWYDGSSVGGLTTHIPIVALQPFFQVIAANSTNKSLDIDAFQFT